MGRNLKNARNGKSIYEKYQMEMAKFEVPGIKE